MHTMSKEHQGAFGRLRVQNMMLGFSQEELNQVFGFRHSYMLVLQAIATIKREHLSRKEVVKI